MSEERWTQLNVHGKTEDLDTITAIVSMIDESMMITDMSDAESLSGIYGNLVDESILNADKSAVTVSVFLPEQENVAEKRGFLQERFRAEGISVSFSLSGVKEEDWAENWKQYYHPLSFGSVTVVPAWQTDYAARPDEKLVFMDPGMAFGTGTHETTRLILNLLEEHIMGGERVLDVGTGSGILAIAASRLGAGEVDACDLDPDAVKNACENVEKNGVSNVNCFVSDLLSAVSRDGGYDLVLANIVADILLLLIPEVAAYMKKDARLILSGVIADRAEDIGSALLKNGFEILRMPKENDWNAFLVKKA